MEKEIEPTVVNYVKNNKYENINRAHCSKLSQKTINMEKEKK